MQELSAYIETSVWSHVFHDDTPDLQRATVEFLRQAKERVVVPYISTLVLDEVARADAKRRDEILGEIAAVRPILLRGSRQADELAERYVEAGVLPPADLVDALHVAIATVHEMDVLTSWNQRHLANIRRRDLFNSVNRVAGYRKMLEIANPLEVLYE
jgi:predicted nucleic acid-binding protein